MLRRRVNGRLSRWFVVVMAGAVALSAVLAIPSLAADGDATPPAKRGDVMSIFKLGFWAEKRGEKAEAAQAYRDAGQLGHKGSRWKLANMYAAGDGVAENDLEAFRIFQGIVNEGAEPGTKEATFVAHALVSLADYVRAGIPDSNIVPDPRRARELLWQAAANFGEPNAQFKLGQMFLDGEGGQTDARQAARWFNLAAQKNHCGAKAMLGHMLFERGKTVRGLAMMTQALEIECPEDRAWIRQMQEEAFAVSSETERRTAIALSQANFQ